MIIRPFLYDVKKTITSKTVLILVAVILMVSLTIIPLSSIRSMEDSASARHQSFIIETTADITF